MCTRNIQPVVQAEVVQKLTSQLTVAITLNPGTYHIWKTSVTRYDAWKEEELCFAETASVLGNLCFVTRMLVVGLRPPAGHKLIHLHNSIVIVIIIVVVVIIILGL